MFDESLNVDLHAPEVIAPIPEAVAPEHAVSTGSPSSTTVDQDAPSPSNSPTTQGTQTPIISHDVEEDNHDIEVAHMDVIHTIVHPDHQVSEHNSKWTKDHPLENIIGALDRPVSTRLQLHEQALFCYYDAFLTSVEPKNYKEALTQACWIEAMQEELHEFERLEVWELVPSSDESILSFLLSGSISQHVNGFVEPDNLTTYTSLRKLLYWVETAPRACMICLSSFQISNDFSKRLSGSYTLLIFPRKATELILVQKSMYDDIIFAASTPELCDLFAKIMCSKFKMSMMGKISFFLGLQISQSPRGIFINQSKYALESLKKYGYESCDATPRDTPKICRSCWLSRYTSSTICAVYNFGERLVSWIVTLKGKKSAAKSSMEAEIYCLVWLVCSILWMRSQLTRLLLWIQNKIQCTGDNESAIALMLQQAHVQQFQIKADRHPFHFIKEPC
ncbi:retrovirus-related pol polyprotein from transposon TNT 1-94 [Tanacetum coccineum]